MSEQHSNFRRLIAGLEVRPAVEELKANAELWKEMQVRQLYEGSAHVDTETIVLRGPSTLTDIFENLECFDLVNMERLPHTVELVRHVAQFLKVREVGRLMVVRLAGGGWIRPHADEGAYARYFARFHLPLVSNEACFFRAGEDRVHMAPGELWWFNHQVSHSVFNRGGARTHLIMDFIAPGFSGALAHIRVPE